MTQPVRFALAGFGASGRFHASSIAATPAAGGTTRPGLFDNFSALVHWPDGASAVVSQTLAAFEHHQTVKVTGTRGAVWAGWSGALDRTTEPTFFLKVFDGETLTTPPITRASGEVFELREEIAACVRCVRDGAAPVASARDGLWSAGLCLLAEESIRTGRPVAVTGRLEPAGACVSLRVSPGPHPP
jgi:myo-inositol 2-dehydrogenase/D-chiro-inositol 1-dehydrogenase